MKSIIATSLIIALSSGFSPGQDAGKESSAKSSEMAAVEANDRAYEAAYARADIQALADFYTEDVSYTGEDGNSLNGRAALAASLSSTLAANKGAKLSIDLDTVRVLAPEVVVEKGSTTVTSKNGETASAMFTAVHVKKDGKWKISELVETPAPVVTAGGHLSELDWLVGDWHEADKKTPSPQTRR